jgi:ubiquinone/menaquinone biosynthesis C-methylase UbiE
MTMPVIYPAGTNRNRLDPTPYRRSMLPPEVVAYYECGDEQDRLTARVGRLEWARTWELLERFLPAPPATILDVGGGPGAYAIPLSLAGHAVHLVDAMPLHVQQARESAAAARTELASIEVGDARELLFPDASADAVLLLGPLYHLIEAADRATALAEAGRVLRPGGVLLAVAISRFASLFDGLLGGWAADHPEIVESGLHTGTHRNPGAVPHRFTTAHFAHPEELAAEVAAAGFEPVALLAVEGPAGLVDDVDGWLDDPRRRAWLLRQVRRVEAEPSLLGASAHVLAVGHR